MGEAEFTGKLALCESEIDTAIQRSRDSILSLQHQDGYWCFELEADCTIPAEYILMTHYMDEIDDELEPLIARYLRQRQEEHDGWPLFTGGTFDISCSVKTYYALKLIGDSPEAPHMKRARAAILAAGGAARSNVFTRITLALFGQVPWRAVPFIPVEIILLPRWFPFHVSKVSYWSRTVMIPLLVLCSLKPRAANPRNVDIRELFTVEPEKEKTYFPVRSHLNRFFLALDKAGRLLETLIPRKIRKAALDKAERWIIERLNGTDGLGAIFPAMVNAHEALACLGYEDSHPARQLTKAALRQLIITKGGIAYCQPCTSPVWDTAFTCIALQEENHRPTNSHISRALEWLKSKQLSNDPGDWRENHPDLPGGGWAFQFNNNYYPDLDDTAVVAWAMHRSATSRYAEPISRAADWICGMQCANGGFAAFDSDNTHYYLNDIPFADHGALLDPPTSDVSARCAGLLALIGRRGEVLERCLDYLRHEQESDGSWFGRWGTNFIYGTWSVLTALEMVEDPLYQFHIERAARWLKKKQNSDGSWGECCSTYFFPEKAGEGPGGSSFQTAWAMLGLMAAGHANCPEVRMGAEYLIRTQGEDGLWWDDYFTAPGFPRVFYLKYHGYSAYFPYWALTRYRALKRKKKA